ncbi:hypothetical protein C8Q80DRAFT_1268955 [Daedaleopsis nitida]|nr:hypothetical protein C8Q80DRAFT_1268955 [Daedaleopsis nitida]
MSPISRASGSPLGILVPPQFLHGSPLDDIFGAYLLGTFAGIVLYGLSVHQLYRYYRLFPSDSLFIRFLVGVVIYYWLVAHYLDIGELVKGVWSLEVIFIPVSSMHVRVIAYITWVPKALPIILSLLMLTTQLFFAKRVFLLGPRYRQVVAIAFLFILGELAFSIATAYKALKATQLWTLESSAWLISITLCFGFVADAMFTVTLTQVLRKSRAELTKTSLLDRFQTYVVNTGLLHCIFNLIAFILVIKLTDTLIDGFFSTVTARLYANSLLAVLNSRKVHDGKGIEIFAGTGTGYALNLIARTNHRMAAETWNVPQVPEEPPVINITVTTEQEGWAKERLERKQSDASSAL